MTDIKLLVLDRNSWNHLTVCKQMISGSLKNVTYKLLDCLEEDQKSWVQVAHNLVD